MCRYQRGNQKQKIEGQKMQWPNEKRKGTQTMATKNTHKTKD